MSLETVVRNLAEMLPGSNVTFINENNFTFFGKEFDMTRFTPELKRMFLYYVVSRSMLIKRADDESEKIIYVDDASKAYNAIIENVL